MPSPDGQHLAVSCGNGDRHDLRRAQSAVERLLEIRLVEKDRRTVARPRRRAGNGIAVCDSPHSASIADAPRRSPWSAGRQTSGRRVPRGPRGPNRDPMRTQSSARPATRLDGSRLLDGWSHSRAAGSRVPAPRYRPGRCDSTRTQSHGRRERTRPGRRTPGSPSTAPVPIRPAGHETDRPTLRGSR